MPRLTEVEKLATSDSSGGRVKTPQKRKYHTFTGSSPARTRGQSRKVRIASAALLEIGDLNEGNQSTRSDASSLPSAALAQIGNPDTGNLSGKAPSCRSVTEDGKKFVSLPTEWQQEYNETYDNQNLEGNRIIDINDLQNVVTKHFHVNHASTKE